MPAETHAPHGLSFLNTRVAVRCSALHGEAAMSVAEHWMPYGEAPPLHRHVDEDEIIHILAGAYRFRIGDREILAGPGDTVVTPRGVAHAFRVESQEGGHCLVMTNGSQFEAFVEELSTPAISAILPPPVPPTPDQQRQMSETGARHGIEILGAPMAA